MLSAQDVRARLRAKEPVVGTWLQLPSTDVAEIIARMGYDFAAVDMEHGSFTRAALPDIFRALERWGTLPFARVAEATLSQIKYALDSGAQGLIFPMIARRAQLDAAMEHALYPGGREFSGGRRGVGFCRANGFGMDFSAYTDAENGAGHGIVLAAQIEHVDALAELDGIFSHPRLDAYMIGPYDLSASMGLTGRFSHPDFTAALTLIEKKAEEHGLAKGYHVVQPDPAALDAKIREGYSFLAYGIDAVFLQAAGRRP